MSLGHLLINYLKKILRVLLIDVFRAFVNKLFKENFNTTFMKNIKRYQNN